MALDINFKILLYKDKDYAILPYEDGLFQTVRVQSKIRFTCLFGDSMSFHQNWQSQATNQPSSKLTKHQILNQQHIHTYIHTYIPTFSEHSGLVLWLLKLVHRPGIPKFLNCSNVKWDYIYFKKYWSGLLFPSPGDLPDPGIKPGFPTLQAESLQSKPPEKPSQRPRMSIWPQLPNIQSNCLHCTSLAVSDNIPYLGYYCLV